MSTGCQAPYSSFDADVFVERAWIRAQSGGDLGKSRCGNLLYQAGQSGTTVSAFSGQLSAITTQGRHDFEVPAGTALLRVGLNGEWREPTNAIINFDLFVQAGSPPSTTSFTCASERFSQNEFCEIPTPAAGTWHVLVNRVQGSGTYQLTATAFATLCSDQPSTDCRAPTAPKKSSLTLKDNAKNVRDAFRWTWTKGAATTTAELGDPLNTTSYELCVYDESSSASSLVMRTAVPAGGTCAGTPCWKATSAGFKYTDKALATGGVRTLELKAGAEGKASIKLTGKGTNLPMPSLPLHAPVTAQLRSSDGQCWGAEFSIATKNLATQFTAKSD